MPYHIDNTFLKDNFGRVVLLRGVNLGGSNRIPSEPNGATHIQYNLYSNKKISFINRPFPLKDADEHFNRLKTWGLHCIRLLITWEAIEHQAPEIYDYDYLEYIYHIIAKAREYGIQVIIDPHQDAWSRFSGGSGAPRWTFEKVGLDVRHFNESGAAILQQTEGNSYTESIWASNYTKLASATMFTLFFGGNDFAPNTQVDSVPVQDYLQQHYINAFKKLAYRLRDLDNIIGFGVMNEPSKGWIGWEDLKSNEFPLRKGASPSPFESMVLASGNPLKVENWILGNRSTKRKGKIEVNSRAVKAWLNGFKCIWKSHGLWSSNSLGEFELQKPNYFTEVKGKKVNFNQDYLLPFINKYTQAIREILPDIPIFVENPIHETPPLWGTSDTKNIIYAPHFYDFKTLLKKTYRSWLNADFENSKWIFGKNKIRRTFTSQIAKFKRFNHEFLRDAPIIISEMGVPMDLNHKKSFKTNHFKKQTKALDMYLKAAEDNGVSVMISNYTADNNNENGDLWNKEDFSVFSREQQLDKNDIYSGGRALKAIIRPYPQKIAGVLLKLSFDIHKLVFELEFEHDVKIKHPTEIFIPKFQYPNGYKVQVSDGNYDLDEQNQILLYHYSVERSKHFIRITKS